MGDCQTSPRQSSVTPPRSPAPPSGRVATRTRPRGAPRASRPPVAGGLTGGASQTLRPSQPIGRGRSATGHRPHGAAVPRRRLVALLLALLVAFTAVLARLA